MGHQVVGGDINAVTSKTHPTITITTILHVVKSYSNFMLLSNLASDFVGVSGHGLANKLPKFGPCQAKESKLMIACLTEALVRFLQDQQRGLSLASHSTAAAA